MDKRQAADRAPACSEVAEALGEPLAGTAPPAKGWLIIEQPGAWGRDALFESQLPRPVAEYVSRQLDGGGGSGIKVLLARRTRVIARPDPSGGDSDQALPISPADGPRTVWWSWSEPGRVSGCSLSFTNPDQLLELDLQALAAGEAEKVHADAVKTTGPMLFLCTNARRDCCCATRSLPIAKELAADPHWASSVAQCSHLGGHRFAPTALQFPQGWVYGRLSTNGVREVLESAAAGRVRLDNLRGRSFWPAAAQAAELVIRRQFGLDSIDLTRVKPDPAGLDPDTLSEPGTQSQVAASAPESTADLTASTTQWQVSELAAGRHWKVRVSEVTGPARPESCGTQPTPSSRFDAVLRQ